jgi:hypothetical protein
LGRSVVLSLGFRLFPHDGDRRASSGILHDYSSTDWFRDGWSRQRPKIVLNAYSYTLLHLLGAAPRVLVYAVCRLCGLFLKKAGTSPARAFEPACLSLLLVHQGVIPSKQHFN